MSRLLFADDTLIFCDADAEQLQYLSWTFMWFEAILGLKVNLSKTEAILVGKGLRLLPRSWVARLRVYLPPIWVSPLGPLTNPLRCGM